MVEGNVNQAEFGRSLVEVPKTSDWDFNLSSGQNADVGEFAITYLDRNGLDFTRRNLQAAFAVLAVDCLQRGLLLAGKSNFTPRDNIRKFIRKGLENRNDLRSSVKGAIEESGRELLLDAGEYVGPFALSSSVLKDAQSQLKSFELTFKIDAFDQIAYQYEARSHFLPEIASFAVSTLPKEIYQQASIDNFSKVRDRARIIRNMLISLAIRKTPLPVISIEELGEIVQNKRNTTRALDRPFLDDFYPVISQRIGIDNPELRLYLNQLLLQVKYALKSSDIRVGSEQTGSEAIISRDNLFRAFGSTLLLLHPALEEEELIVNPSKASEGSYSLWREEFSTDFEGQRVPTTDGLYRALRLANARGYGSERFENGIQAWKDLARDRENEGRKHERLSEQIDLLSTEIKSLRRWNAVMPQVALEIAKGRAGRLYERFSEAKGRRSKNVRRISSARDLRDKWNKYMAGLAMHGASDDSKKVPIPDWLLLKFQQQEKHRQKTSARYADRRLENAQDRLYRDLINWYEVLWIEATNEEIETEIVRLQTLLDSSSVGVMESLQMSKISREELTDRVDDLLSLFGEKLPSWRFRQQGDRERIEILNKIKKAIKSVKFSEVAKLVYNYSLINRMNALEVILIERGRLKMVEAAPMGVHTEWSREEIVAFSKQVDVETSCLDCEAVQAENLKALRNWNFSRQAGIFWPSPIPDKDSFLKWTLEEIKGLEGSLPELEPKKLKSQLGVLKDFINILDNPLFPLPEGAGLKPAAFWDGLTRRVNLVSALADFERSEKQLHTAKGIFERTAKRIYIESLQLKRDEIQQELDLLKEHPDRRRFMAKMRELNLVLVETGETSSNLSN